MSNLKKGGGGGPSKQETQRSIKNFFVTLPSDRDEDTGSAGTGVGGKGAASGVPDTPKTQ